MEVSPASWSFIAWICISVFSQKFQDILFTYPELFLIFCPEHSTSVFLNSKRLASLWFPHPCAAAWKLGPGSKVEKLWAPLHLVWFLSLRNTILYSCHLMPGVICFIYFTWFCSCLRQEGKFSPCHSVMTGSQSGSIYFHHAYYKGKETEAQRLGSLPKITLFLGGRAQVWVLISSLH